MISQNIHIVLSCINIDIIHDIICSNLPETDISWSRKENAAAKLARRMHARSCWEKIHCRSSEAEETEVSTSNQAEESDLRIKDKIAKLFFRAKPENHKHGGNAYALRGLAE
jgi:hypothetical protein